MTADDTREALAVALSGAAQVIHDMAQHIRAEHEATHGEAEARRDPRPGEDSLDAAIRAEVEMRHGQDDFTAVTVTLGELRAALAAARRDPEPTPFSSTSATHYLRDALDHWLRNGSSIEAADDLRTAAAEWLRDIEDGSNE